ncbi:MAG: hypothetical protein PUA56_01940 [Bacillales bacterium]|nr:hypothetical protein [Bacillales bacterium]
MKSHIINIENINKRKSKLRLFNFAYIVFLSFFLILGGILDTVLKTDIIFGLVFFFDLTFVIPPVVFAMQYNIRKVNEGDELTWNDFYTSLFDYYNSRMKGIYRTFRSFIFLMITFLFLIILLEVFLFIFKYPVEHDFGHLYLTTNRSFLSYRSIQNIINHIYYFSYLVFYLSFIKNISTFDFLYDFTISKKMAIRINNIMNKKYKKERRKNAFPIFLIIFSFTIGYYLGVSLTYFFTLTFYLGVAISYSIALLFTYPFLTDFFLKSAEFYLSHREEYQLLFTELVEKELIELGLAKQISHEEQIKLQETIEKMKEVIIEKNKKNEDK